MNHQKKSNLFEMNSITAEQLKNKLDSNPDMILINVLNEETYIDCHITGSINIPLARLVESIASWDKDKEIVIYCAENICSASDQAYQIMADMGFIHISCFKGGMKEWFKKRFDTTGTCTLKYLHI
jgi:rhodanese-related sulfurtransferase